MLDESRFRDKSPDPALPLPQVAPKGRHPTLPLRVLDGSPSQPLAREAPMAEMAVEGREGLGP